jgi:Glycerol-3-phosphate dehydrogenase
VIAKRIGEQGASWTGEQPLPGGKMPVDGVLSAEAELAQAYPFLSAENVRRLIYQFGCEAADMLNDAPDMTSLGDDFGHGLTAREVDWMMTHEWARTADDVLWRRTKLGLVFDADQRAALDAYMADKNKNTGAN